MRLARTLMLVLCMGLLSTSPARASHGATTRVSVSSSGEEASGHSYVPAVSADGRYVAFVSSAPNLVPGDTNGWPDVFVHDRVTGVTERVSISSSGEEADWDSAWPSISADGRFVAFKTWASNLAGSPPRIGAKMVVRDRVAGVTKLASVALDGGATFATLGTISPDGRLVAYISNARNILPEKTDESTYDIFVFDHTVGLTTRIVAAIRQDTDSFVWRPALSWDGRFVAFMSDSNELVPDDPSPYFADVFLYDRATATTIPVSVPFNGGTATGGASSPAISADGRYVAFSDSASLQSHERTFRGGIYIYDTARGTTVLASRSPEGDAYDVSSRPSLSADGRLLAFISDGMIMPPELGTAWLLVHNAVPTQVFVRDLQTGSVTTMSSSTGGQMGNGHSEFPLVAGGGSSVAFQSEATNLVRGDSNGRLDVFVHELIPNAPTCADGRYEEGELSGPVHETVEPSSGPAGPFLHTLSCDAVSPLGL